MKIERLLGIVVYLLNRELVNTNTLAEKFEVSTRTIQRDIETLNLAGIPIISIQGTNGGYGIIDSFKLDKQIASVEDYQFIITALTGMNSAYNNRKIEATLEKLLNVSKEEQSVKGKVRLDFSASREGNNIDEYLKVIEDAIDKENVIEFEYTNSYGTKTLRELEPIGVVYKWYAWYLLGYCCDKKDYRLFKVLRMRDLKKLNKPFSMKHESFDDLLAKQEQQDSRKYIDVKLLCKEELRISIEEYFPNATITAKGDGDLMIEFHVPNNEIGWKGLIFTYGNNIKIIEPEELIEEVRMKAEEIINIYK
ncbi:helix-turn-helix transcriptional regulator [Inconstantimicrobium mannanitabidum]|uniref:DeoR family transcriptional regulator n=1 Tax=Inconstantimicrobium mannanitabidum TaxID=1604901 RepID=A0ACB5RHC1_9CLOT|nr:YafY family protein [Clostridium sp. TW13]GKX68503.1 DeoR family transcriptional regulator [Clostridium sp. TW13]